VTQTTLTAPGSITISERIEHRLHQGKLTQKQVDDFKDFLAKVASEFFDHRIITNNAYTRWFRNGTATDEELRHFLRQFSVFSNQFLVAALLKEINSPTLQQSRATREILLNELGVIYRQPEQVWSKPVGSDEQGKQGKQGEQGELKSAPTTCDHTQHEQTISDRIVPTEEEKERQGDPELVSTEGTVDGGVCRFRAAHFEWLIVMAQGLGLDYADIGKRKHGRATTLHFCDELIRLYGNDDPQIAEGASFAVENWAAAGFWQELEEGLMRIKQTRHPHLRLAFFTWHNRVEAQHAKHTLEELEEVYFQPEFDRAKFFEGGKEILEAIAVFWDGLNDDRLNHVYD
jgi:hypothetical protein